MSATRSLGFRSAFGLFGDNFRGGGLSAVDNPGFASSTRLVARAHLRPLRPRLGSVGSVATMTAKHPRQKGPKRSLNSRKREKDVSGALLENCFRPEKVEFKKANWESAVPRKMQILMGAAARAASGTPRQSKGPREDLPRDPSQSKRSKAARAAEKAAKAEAAPALPLSGQKAAPAPLPTAAPAAPGARAVLVPDAPKAEASRTAPKKPETAAMEAERLRSDAHALGAALSARNQSHRKAAKPVGFGSTNEAPPELKVKGRFGRLAAEATARRPPRAEPAPAPAPALAQRCCYLAAVAV